MLDGVTRMCHVHNNVCVVTVILVGRTVDIDWRYYPHGSLHHSLCRPYT